MPPSTSRNSGIDFKKDIFATLFLAAGIFFGICLVSYSPTDPALNSVSSVPYVKNWGGLVGAYLADILFIVFGISAYLASVVFILMSVLQYAGKPVRLRMREIACYTGLIAFAAALIHLRLETVSIRGHEIAGGGIIGGLLGSGLSRYLNTAGAYIVSFAGFFLFFTLATRLSIGDILRGLKTGTVWLIRRFAAGVVWTVRRVPGLIGALFRTLKRIASS
nr:DNA translocase FtsK 4TM domain-containing protein [bacterium]